MSNRLQSDMQVSKLNMLCDISMGMSFLHGFDPPILHRDLKAANCLCTEEYEVKLTDFGESKALDNVLTMTQAGTPTHVAPEVILGERYDERADVYSFAVVMYEVASQQKPYADMQLSPMLVASEVAGNGLRPLTSAMALEDPVRYPRAIVELMERCWSPHMSDRPSSFRDILSELMRIGKEDLKMSVGMKDQLMWKISETMSVLGPGACIDERFHAVMRHFYHPDCVFCFHDPIYSSVFEGRHGPALISDFRAIDLEANPNGGIVVQSVRFQQHNICIVTGRYVSSSVYSNITDNESESGHFQDWIFTVSTTPPYLVVQADISCTRSTIDLAAPGGGEEEGDSLLERSTGIVEAVVGVADDLDAQFDTAVDFLNCCKDGSITLPEGSRTITLKLYGYYKQATCGICNQKRPFSRLQMRRLAMFQSWKACGSMSAEEAKRRYVRTVKESFGKQYDKYMENEND